MPSVKLIRPQPNPLGSWNPQQATFCFNNGISLSDWLQFEAVADPITIRIGPNTSVRLVENLKQVHYILEAGANLIHFNPLKANQLAFDIRKGGHLTHASGITWNSSSQSLTSQVHLQEPNASVSWQEGIRVSSDQSYHTALVIDHQAPHTHSICKTHSVVEGNGHFQFQCDLLAQTNAPQSTLYQRNLNLITNPDGQVFARPQLHIFNRSIEASHGTATQPLPEDALWYLQSRGIPYDSAVKLYLDGFVHSVFSIDFQDFFPHESI